MSGDGYARRGYSSGGVSGYHDWEMTDGSICCLTTEEAREINRQRTILQAAIQQDGQLYTLPRPNRHHHIIHGPMTGIYQRSASVQGFLTSAGGFVDREEAARLALKSGQIKELTHPPLLYSEDLW